MTIEGLKIKKEVDRVLVNLFFSFSRALFDNCEMFVFSNVGF